MTIKPQILRRRSLNFLSLLASIAILTQIASPTFADRAADKHLKALPKFLVGGDISMLGWEEQNGQVFKVNGQAEPALKIFKDAGWNFARIKIWVNPDGGDGAPNSLPYVIKLGKEIKGAGLILSLDFHYSDTWADPGKQYKPAAWANLPFDQLTQKLHDYTADVISQMNAGGAMPDIVDIGNEITGGMLWPDGRDANNDFTNLGTLLKAADQGVTDGSKGGVRPLTLIHIDRGGDWKGTQWFFDGINSQHVHYDLIGLSYYPMYHGPMSGLSETLQNAAVKYKKPIIVVETGYAYRSQYARLGASHDYPFTPDGQNQFMADLVPTVQKTPNGLGRGILWWEPEWIPVTGQRGGWELTLFDTDGNALPALFTLGKPGLNPTGH